MIPECSVLLTGWLVGKQKEAKKKTSIEETARRTMRLVEFLGEGGGMPFSIK